MFLLRRLHRLLCEQRQVALPRLLQLRHYALLIPAGEGQNPTADAANGSPPNNVEGDTSTPSPVEPEEEDSKKVVKQMAQKAMK